MKNIKFSRLEIKNFRNINELSFDFNKDITEIVASNGKGKTNTMSAIMWCIFGKDINDNKSFTISPIIDGVEDNGINTVVKLIINENYIIERSYCKRVTTLKTGYIIDSKEQLVSSTQTQFKQELLENFVDEETFKSLSNINYIPNLHWKELKKLIFDLIGDIKDEEILLRDDFSKIEEYITRFGIDQTQKLLSETDKELSNDIKRLETEYQTLLNTKEKYVGSAQETEQLEKRKLEIENDLYSTQEKQNENSKALSYFENKKREISNLTYENNKIKNDIEFNESNIKEYKDLYDKNGYDVELLRNTEIDILTYELNKINDDLEYSKQGIITYTEQLEIYKTAGNNLKNKEIKVENNTCNSCGQNLPEHMVEETLSKLKKEHLEELERIKIKYDELKDFIKLAEDKVIKLETEIKLKEVEVENVKTKVYEIDSSKETDKQKQLIVAMETKELQNNQLKISLLEKEKELAEKEKEFDKLELPISMLDDNDNLPLRLELKEINDKLATTITLSKISEDVESTLEKLNSKKDNKILNKEKIQEAIKFNNIKAELLKQKIRNYFKEVNFITKEFTIDGTEQETFKIANDKGIEWKDVNTGHKILLSVDLLQGIMKAKDIYVPIIIDNGENVTNEIIVDNTQLILARALKGIDKIEIK